MLPLIYATLGIPVQIKSMRGSGALQKKMLDLGIIPGSMVTVTSSSPGIPLILEVHDSRVALDYQTGSKIFIA